MKKATELLAASHGVRNFSFKKSSAETVVLKLLKEANAIVGDEKQPLENRLQICRDVAPFVAAKLPARPIQ